MTENSNFNFIYDPIKEKLKENYFSLPDGLQSDDEIRKVLFEFLR